MEHPDSGTDGEITVLLRAWKRGEKGALEALLPAVYPRLHSIAASYMRRERHSETLQATGLVNELYLTLARQRKIGFDERGHFFSFAAWAMRLILRDYARDRNALKRGADGVRVPLSDDLQWIDAGGPDMIDLERALDELRAVDARSCQVLELKAFLGCSTEEAAELTGVSKATADRDLRFGKAWLYQKLRGAESSPD
jgi:RNA polymerase sigma factor (TIGR02999 family)